MIAADAAFPLSTHIMKKMTIEQRIFNYRLSRVRRVVENTLENRFTILLNISVLTPEKVKSVTQN